MDNYPAEVKKIKDMAVDKAIKTVLFAVTFGEAKELISWASSAYEGLVVLKRHFAQTTVTKKHLECQKLFNMNQRFRESASEFISRIRKQLGIAKSMGCKDFDEEEVVVEKRHKKELKRVIEDVKNCSKNEENNKLKKTYAQALLGKKHKPHPIHFLKYHLLIICH